MPASSPDYLYEFEESSPLFLLISERFYLFIAKLLPKWIHPNWLTISTFVLTSMTFLLYTHYDYYLLASSWYIPEIQSVPDWLWLWTAVGFTLEYLLDGVDGVFARLTGQTTKWGEFLDHSIDIFRLNITQPLVFCSLFGREDFGLPASSMQLALLAIQTVTFVTFLFQRITGKLFLPWCYDLNHFYMIFMFLSTWYRGGSESWKHRPYHPTFSLSNAEIVYYSILVNCLVISLPMQIWKFARFCKEKGLNIGRIVACLPSLVWFLAVVLVSQSVCFGVRLHRDCFLNTDPRIVLLAYSLTLSNSSLNELRDRVLSLQPKRIDFIALSCILVTLAQQLFVMSIVWRQFFTKALFSFQIVLATCSIVKICWLTSKNIRCEHRSV